MQIPIQRAYTALALGQLPSALSERRHYLLILIRTNTFFKFKYHNVAEMA